MVEHKETQAEACEQTNAHLHSHEADHEHSPECSQDEPGHQKHEHEAPCEHEHDHEHAHEHEGPCDHEHEHADEDEHKHEHSHEHEGPCEHEHDHEHSHEHEVPCNHKHEHAHGHSHGHSCDHAHHHEPPADDRIGHRDAESGGRACQFSLDFILPGETDEKGIFEKLEELLESKKGVGDVHIRKDSTRLELCIHYDTENTTIDMVVALAKTIASEVRKRYKRASWFIRGMESVQCANNIEHALNRLKGVLQANVAYAAERLIVEFEGTTFKRREIEKCVQALGYELEEPEKGHACSFHAHDGGLAPKLEMPLVVAAGILLALGLAIPHVLPGSPTGMSQEHLATGCFVIAMFSAGLLPIRGTFNSLKHGICDIETLMVIAAVGAAFLGAWFEGAFLLFLFSLGHGLEHRMLDKARKALDSLAKLRPEKARIKIGDEIKEIPIEEVMRGDLVLIRPGDRIPLDGIIKFGETSLDEATITGESIPQAKGIGDHVFAGTGNLDGSIEFTVSKLSSESVLSRIIDMVAEAEAQKSPSQRFAQRMERTFVPIVLVGAPAFSVLLVCTGLDLQDAVLRGISVLVAASPCALALATPATVLAAVTRAARGGVLIKGGAYLETLGNISAIAFDKTGTLTEGKPKVKLLAPLNGISPDRLLAVAASGEAHSTHPVAIAVVEEANLKNLCYKSAESSQAVHGQGIISKLNGDQIAIGNLKLFEKNPPPQEVLENVAGLERQGQTTLVVQENDIYLGVIGVSDRLRSESKAVIKELKELGINKTIMLSGDNQVVARAIGEEVGTDEVEAPLLPHEKVEMVKVMAKQHEVAMVGDGVNDAPALAAASIGIAVGGTASDVAMETADMVLMSNGLSQLPFAIALARKANATIKQNMTIALGVSALLVLASVFGWVKISQAVVLHEGSTILVLLNGLKLLRFRK